MLIEFKVANYRSIRGEQTLSMVASNYSDELPQNLISCDHVPGLKGTKLVKAVALYGANASGKSNIVSALRFFAEFVRDSATKYKPDSPTKVEFDQLIPAGFNLPTRFEISAVIDGIWMLYGIEMNFIRVTREHLVTYPRGRAQVWFEREWNPNELRYDWSRPTAHFRYDDTLRDAVRSNASFVATAAQLNHELATKIWSWFANDLLFLNLAGEIPDWSHALRFVRTNEDKQIFEQAMSAADLGVAGVGVRAPLKLIFKRLRDAGVEPGTSPANAFGEALDRAWSQPPLESEDAEPCLKHRGEDGKIYELDFDLAESTGTRRYFTLLGYWFLKLSRGGPLIVDEIEASLHPLLVHALIEVFLQGTGEPTNAQLIFTTHNPLLLDQTLLRRDQIWFTEKDQEGATRLYPLTDFKPRKDESLVKGYLSGRYGGIPFIPESLKF